MTTLERYEVLAAIWFAATQLKRPDLTPSAEDDLLVDLTLALMNDPVVRAVAGMSK